MIANRRTLLILIAINGLVYLLYLRDLRPESRDYKAFYNAAHAAEREPSRIYDVAGQRMAQNDGHFIPFFHPPHELLVLLPFAALPYAVSFTAWRVFSVLCLVASGLLLSRTLSLDRITAVLLALAMAPVGMCLAIGQDSLLLMLLLCGCFYLLKMERDAAAALVLSLALFKPQIPMILAIALLAIGRKKFVGWFAGTSAALTAASIAFVERDGIKQMLEGEKIAEQWVGRMSSVRALIAFTVGDHPWLAIALLMIGLMAMFAVWRRSRSLDFAVASAICLGAALTPYIFAYDLVVLAIPLALISQRPQKHDWLIAVFLTSAVPLLILAILKATSLFVIPTFALGVMTFRLASPRSEPAPALAAEPQLS